VTSWLCGEVPSLIRPPPETPIGSSYDIVQVRSEGPGRKSALSWLRWRQPINDAFTNLPVFYSTSHRETTRDSSPIVTRMRFKTCYEIYIRLSWTFSWSVIRGRHFKAIPWLVKLFQKCANKLSVVAMSIEWYCRRNSICRSPGDIWWLVPLNQSEGVAPLSTLHSSTFSGCMKQKARSNDGYTPFTGFV
jgi:hypothetical protein